MGRHRRRPRLQRHAGLERGRLAPRKHRLRHLAPDQIVVVHRSRSPAGHVAAVWWAFGGVPRASQLIWWGTNYPARYTFIGGAFLREDWLMAAVAGICLAKRQYMGASGFALAWSALLRIFPAFIFTGLVAKIALDSWRDRTIRIGAPHRRFAAGAALALGFFLPLSMTVGVSGPPDPSVWSAFAQNSRKHLATPLTNNVGLPTVLSFEPSMRAARIGKYWLDSPWDVWIDAHRAAFDRRLPFFVALAALFTARSPWRCAGATTGCASPWEWERFPYSPT